MGLIVTTSPEIADALAARTADALAWLIEFHGRDDDGYVRLATDAPACGWTDLPGFRAGRNDFAKLDNTAMIDTLASSIIAAADGGLDLFACPYRHRIIGRRAGEARARRHVHADIDGPADLDRARALGCMAVASGTSTEQGDPHAHVYLRLDRAVTAIEHSALCRALGQLVGGEHHDTSKTGDADVLRPPGTLNHKHDQTRPVTWLTRPDDPGVRTWQPDALAVALGIDWPPPDPRAGELRARVDAVRGAGTGASSGTDRPRCAAGGRLSADAGGARRRLDGLLRAVADAAPGSGNNGLNWAAGVAGAIVATEPEAPDEADVRAELVEAFCSRPVPTGERPDARRREAEATVASGWSWGAANPDEALADRHPTAPPQVSQRQLYLDGDGGVDDGNGGSDAGEGGGQAQHRKHGTLRVTRASKIPPTRPRAPMLSIECSGLQT